MDLAGQWLSLMEYATQNDVSLSTLRRHIKANKVQYRSDQGRYFIWSESMKTSKVTTAPSDQSTGPEVFQLLQELKRAQIEIAELKTLVAFYEEQDQSRS
jgi:hypothetical protein